MQWLPAEPDIMEPDGGIVFRYRYGRAPVKRMHNFFSQHSEKGNARQFLGVTDYTGFKELEFGHDAHFSEDLPNGITLFEEELGTFR